MASGPSTRLLTFTRRGSKLAVLVPDHLELTVLLSVEPLVLLDRAEPGHGIAGEVGLEEAREAPGGRVGAGVGVGQLMTQSTLEIVRVSSGLSLGQMFKDGSGSGSG